MVVSAAVKNTCVVEISCFNLQQLAVERDSLTCFGLEPQLYSFVLKQTKYVSFLIMSIVILKSTHNI